MSFPSRTSLIIAAFGLFASMARALVIVDYSEEANNRFSSDFFGTPIGNTSPAYIGADYDFSGVGWIDGSGETGGIRVRNAILLTPVHTIMANHYAPAYGTPYLFSNTDDVTYTNSLLKSTVVSTPGYTNDLLVGTLTSTFSTAQKVTPYRILDTRDGDSVNQTYVIYGSNADNLGPRIGLAKGLARSTTTSPQIQGWVATGSTTPDAALYWESGDSGSPAFVRYTAPDGTTSLTLVGPAFGANAPTTLAQGTGNAGIYNPSDSINATTKLDGYAIKWTIYDNASDTAHTSPQWTGAGGNVLGNAANWSQSLNPAGLSVLFDAGTTATTNLAVNSATSLRGALFKASDSGGGFTFTGAGTLSLGYTGLRNESTATQTFDVGIVLAGSQNWEAANGNLVFNGAIATTAGAHLVIVGGARDTTFNGVVSGAGGLAKDDAGILTLNAANTYTGKTWIHDGTLRLGTTGALLNTAEVIFDTTNSAVLDLAGHNQTLAGLRSVFGGTGHVALGGATLTLDLATANSFAGDITGAGNLTKSGAGLLTLTGENTYGGTTTINPGTLRTASAGALSATTHLVLAGGVLELGGSDYTGALGTGAGQVSLSGSGGFGAYGATRSVNLGGAAAPLTWGDTHFVQAGNALLLSSATSTATVDFKNALILGTTGSGARDITVDNGSAALDARLSGNLTSPGSTFGINKNGTGTLELTGNNTYAGATTIKGGALRIGSATALSNASNIILAGGVLELGSGDYTATLGSGAGQVRFTGAGGFSAAGANRAVNLGGASTPLTVTWGSADFVPAGNALILSSAGSDATVDFRNSINFGTGSGTRTVQVDNGSAAIDARISGDLTDSGTYTFSKTGAGTLELTGTNTWHGGITVNGGVLRIGSVDALPAGNVVISAATLELAAGDYTAALGSGGGQVRFGAGGGGFSAAGADRIVNLGGAGAAITWGQANFVAVGNTLWFSSSSADATLIFQNGLILGTSGTGSRNITANDGSAAVDVRLTGNISSPGGTFGLNKNGTGTMELAGTNTYTGATTINGGALRFASAAALPSTSNIVLNGGVLELTTGNYVANLGTGAGQISFSGSGGFSAVGATRTVTLNNGSPISWGSGIPITATLILSSTSADAMVDFKNPLTLYNTGPETRTVQVNNGSAAVDARLSGTISQNSGNYGITKTGLGTLELTASNSYKGLTQINAGTLHINGNQSTATGDVIVASGAMLGGFGRIGGATFITSGGTLALGTTPRLLTFDSTLTFDADSIFIVTLNKGNAAAIAGTDYDRIAVGSAATLNGTQLSLNLTSSFVATAQQGTVFTILTADGLIGNTSKGAFTSITLNGTRYDFGIGYTDTALTLTLQNISAVPEPATAVLIAALVIGAYTVVRKRRLTGVRVYQP
jgi:autotransporter-associated beta strand protein